MGFRAPSLNELFRGFRVGNNFTLANAGLTPEELHGVEIGAGDDNGAFTWNLTGFWNQISDAITNVTLATGPVTYPGAGFIPSGGQVLQRQNVGDIRAFGIEGDVQWAISDMVSLRGGFNLTDAHVLGGTVAPHAEVRRGPDQHQHPHRPQPAGGPAAARASSPSSIRRSCSRRRMRKDGRASTVVCSFRAAARRANSRSSALSRRPGS